MRCSSWKSFPPGRYLINNGRKEEGGRFAVGTHAAVRRLFVAFPQVKFTTEMKDADYVILPEGIKEPGAKVLSRNIVLRNPDNYIWLSQVGHLMRATNYEVVEVKRGKTDQTIPVAIPKNIRLPEEVGPLFDPHVFLKMESHGTRDPRVPRIAFGYKSDYDRDVDQMRALLTTVADDLRVLVRSQPRAIDVGIVQLLRTLTCVKRCLHQFRKYDDGRSVPSHSTFEHLIPFVENRLGVRRVEEEIKLRDIYAEVKALRIRLYETAADLTYAECSNLNARRADDEKKSSWLLTFNSASTVAELVEAYFAYFKSNQPAGPKDIAEALSEPQEEDDQTLLRWSRQSMAIQRYVGELSDATGSEDAVKLNIMFVLTKSWCLHIPVEEWPEGQRKYLEELTQNMPNFALVFAPYQSLFRWLNLVYQSIVRLNEEAYALKEFQNDAPLEVDRDACLLRWLRTMSDNVNLFTREQFLTVEDLPRLEGVPDWKLFRSPHQVEAEDLRDAHLDRRGLRYWTTRLFNFISGPRW